MSSYDPLIFPPKTLLFGISFEQKLFVAKRNRIFMFVKMPVSPQLPPSVVKELSCRIGLWHQLTFPLQSTPRGVSVALKLVLTWKNECLASKKYLNRHGSHCIGCLTLRTTEELQAPKNDFSCVTKKQSLPSRLFGNPRRFQRALGL